MPLLSKGIFICRNISQYQPGKNENHTDEMNKRKWLLQK